MDDALKISINPECALAFTYAPFARANLILLWKLDTALGRVAITHREPALTALRLTWWRDALIALDTAGAPAEPLLRAVATSLLPAGVTGNDLSRLAVAWGTARDEVFDNDASPIALRGASLFKLAALLLGGNDMERVRKAGSGWALVDAARRLPIGDRAEGLLSSAALALQDAGAGRWRVALRPLGMLAALARRDAQCSPASLARQGSPLRIARMMAHRLSGY